MGMEEGSFDQSFLHRLQRAVSGVEVEFQVLGGKRTLAIAGTGSRGEGKLWSSEFVAVADQHHPLDGMSEFADVSGPGVTKEIAEPICGDIELGPAVLALVFIEEVLDQ